MTEVAIALAPQPADASDPAPGFPIRVGVVDMGSNAIRLVAAEFIAPTTWADLAAERVPVRLGHDAYRSGSLDPAAIDAAIRAMVRFRGLLEEFDVPHYRAVATSAVRESRNGFELMRRVRTEADLVLEVITGAEEARLVYWAARDRVPLGDAPWLLADLGGGSLEIALVDRAGILAFESQTIGSVRLMEDFEQGAGDWRRFYNLVDEYLSALRVPTLEAETGIDGFIATGGNMEDLAVLADGRETDAGAVAVDVDALARVIDRLAGMSVEERIERLELRRDRADVILPAAMVYHRLARLVGVEEIHVPFVGVKEGVMLDLVEGLVAQTGYDARHAREVMAGAVAFGRRFRFDEAHGVHVARLAERLFDELAPLHELRAKSREILAAGAVLHDVGQRISFARHHKHSHYLIANSELPGLSREEIDRVAQVARYHRKAHPGKRHAPFAALDRDGRREVARLAAILRLADALDNEHRGAIRDVRAAVDDDEVVLTLIGDGDLDLERWALEKKADLFEEVFGYAVRSEAGRDGA